MPIHANVLSVQVPPAMNYVGQNDPAGVARDGLVNGAYSPAEPLVNPSKKLENDMMLLGKKIKYHEENIKYLRTHKNSLDDVITHMQVTLGEYHSSSAPKIENEDLSHVQSEEATVENIMKHGKSAAAILCQLKRHRNQVALTKDILGVVATLGKVDDDNLSRLLSEFLGLDNMLALVCMSYEGVKALESYDKEGSVSKTSCLHGLGASIGLTLEGRFNVICLENLSFYSKTLRISIFHTRHEASKKGDFSFVAAHSRYSELQLTVKVCVELPPEMEHVNIKHLSSDETILPLVDLDAPLDSQMDYMSVQHHIPDTNASPLRDLYYDEGIGTDLESCLGFQKDLEDELLSFGLRIGQHEKNIKLLQCDQRETESDLFELQLAKDQVLCIGTYGSCGKNEMREKVECKTDSAAAVVMKLFKEVQHQDYYGLTESILGVVALLGTAPTLELSKVFAEFLGDQMLAVVCKSYKDVRILEAYKRNGKLNREHGLHMFGAELGQSINGRYHVLCIQNIRPCEAGKDVDEKLLLPDPILPNGAAPAGFLGYAVNMINIDVDHHDTKTDSGFGLRETLFYCLFGETQVYESRKHMKNAISCIKDGAVSLDGGIIRGNGALSLGCWEPDIIFPIVATRNQDLPPRATQVLTDYREKKLKLKDITDQLTQEERAHKKALKRFKKRRDMYDKYFTHKQPVNVSPITSLKGTPVKDGLHFSD